MNGNDLSALFKKHNFKFFTRGLFNLNIFGIRATNGKVERFDDLICIAYKTRDGWTTLAMDATTSPGGISLNEISGSLKGTAILPAGKQYKMMIGTHKGKYEALVQAEPFTVIRDNDKDGKLSFDGLPETGWFGINLHHATSTGKSLIIGNWSLGCQVISSIIKWNFFWKVVKKSASIFGKKFTYSLFDECELDMCIHDFKEKMNE